MRSRKRDADGCRAVLEQAFNGAQATGAPGVNQTGSTYTLDNEATRNLELAKHQNDY